MRPGNVRRRAGGGALDTQTVTTGSSSGPPTRERGYFTGAFGSITDGTSNLYGGAVINCLYWYENGGAGADYVYFEVAGLRANSGWTTLTLNGHVLNRAAATFGAGGVSFWRWDNLNVAPTFYFGLPGATISAVFS